MWFCRCPNGFSGSYCEIAAASASSEEVALLASLGTLLPVVAIGLVIVVALCIYQQIRSTLDYGTDTDER